MAHIGGKKSRRVKSGGPVTIYTPIAKPQELQIYGQVENILGGPHITVKCFDKKEPVQRMAVIPGKFKGRKHWLQKGTFVLLNLREYEDKKADVIYVYSPEDVKYLRSINELEPETIPDDEADVEFVNEENNIKSNTYDIENLPDEEVDLDSL
jgi:initiation factor 1A